MTLDLRSLRSYFLNNLLPVFRPEQSEKRILPMKTPLFLMLLATLPFMAPDAMAAGQDGAKAGEEVVWGEMPAGARTAYIGIHGGTVPVSLLTAGDGSPMIAQVGLTGSDFLNFLRSKGRLEEELVLSDAPIPAEGGPEPLPIPKLQPARPSESADSTQETPAQTVAAQDGSIPPVGEAAPAENATRSAQTEAPRSAENIVQPAGNATQPAELSALPSQTNTLALAGSPDGDIPVIYATGHAFERMSLIPKNWAPFGLTEKALSVEGEVKVLSTPKKQPRTQKRSR